MVRKLYQPLELGALKLQHGVVMAPLTRMRAGEPGQFPRDMAAEHYGQRSSPGTLLIAEASQISREGQGYGHTPGCFTPEQVRGWKKVTAAVHEKGGKTPDAVLWII